MADKSAEAEPEPQGESKPGLVDRAQARLAVVRQRRPLVDHAVRTVEHIGVVQGTILAGAVTYFGFLSFFPVLVIGFAVVSYVAAVVPEARDQTIAAIQSIFPGLVGTGPDAAIDIDTIADKARAIGLLAFAGLLYSGLGWISAMRAGLQGVFRVPPSQRRNLVLGKAIDLAALAVIGVVLVVSVALSSAAANLTDFILGLLLLDDVPGFGVLVGAVGVALGVLASTVLFFTIFTLLTTSQLPRRAVAKGAFAAALGFEVLKLLASKLIALSADNPGTAVLGISLVLLVWINYFSRVVMVGAAWAYTSPEARLIRFRQAERQRSREELADRRRRRRERYGGRHRPRARPSASALDPAAQRHVDRVSVAAGATVGATATALVVAVRRRR